MLSPKKLKVSVWGQLNDPAHKGDAGRDVIAVAEPKIVGEKFGNSDKYYRRIDYIEYDTGVTIQPDEEVFAFSIPRSSISKHTNLFLGNSIGVIDTHFRDTIKFRFRYLPQPEDYVFVEGRIFMSINPNRLYHKGDRIGQLIFSKQIGRAHV